MPSPIDRLKKFRERILGTTVFDRAFAEFIAIEVLDFISKESPEVARIFNSRLNYLKNLALDRDFNKLQDEMFDAVQNILGLVAKKDVENMQEEFRNATLNRFKDKSPDYLTLPEMYEKAKDRENYYRLGDESYRAHFDGEISSRINTVCVKKQFESMKPLLNRSISYAEEKNPKLKDIIKQYVERYNKTFGKLEEHIYRTPKKIHFENFEQFFIFCAKVCTIPGEEFYHTVFKQNFYNGNQAKQLSEIQNHATIVLEDLIEALEHHPTHADSPKPSLSSAKLKFYPDDSTAEYRGTSFQFKTGTKSGELLRFFNGSKNTPLELRFIQARCNQRIKIARHHFKTEKDVNDTIRAIRQKLKVRTGEYFPLYKTGNSFILEER